MTENFSEQIRRIKEKICLAKKTDKNLEVFGANHHKYQINAPVTLEEVLQFEQKYSVMLPECYRSFILQVGNGGVAYPGHYIDDCAAGPYYGIFPFGSHLDSLVNEWKEEITELDVIAQLINECVIFPGITDAEWKSIIDKEEKYEGFSPFQGILPLGSQGCSYSHGLILNGKYRGRVVYLDEDKQKPIFPFETNFLNWYERWLNDIISRDLITNLPVGVALCKGGTESALLEEYKNTVNLKDKQDCLVGLLYKKKLGKNTLDQIETLLGDCTKEHKTLCIQMLCKSDYDRARPYLLELVKTDMLPTFQFVFWYAKDKSKEWLPFIKENIHTIDHPETFRFCTYLLQETRTRVDDILAPFWNHSDRRIREQAAYVLGWRSSHEYDIITNSTSTLVHASFPDDAKEKNNLTGYYSTAIVQCDGFNPDDAKEKNDLSGYCSTMIVQHDASNKKHKKWWQF